MNEVRSKGIQIRFGIASEQGRRPRNEDYAGLYEGTALQRIRQGIVAAVADGVGGAKGGRVAAELAVRTFIDGYYAQPATVGVHHAAAASIDAFNRWIHQLGRTDAMLENASCTFTSLILLGRKAHVLHVGDSRAYRLSGDDLVRLTEDHTLKHPDLRHVLFRAIGIEPSVRLDYSAETLKPHDRLLLCSDGVHGTLGDRRIRDLLIRGLAPEEAAREIVASAFQAGSTDNITALVIDVISLPPAEHADLESAIAALPIRDPVPRTGDTVDGFRLDSVLSDGRYSRLFKAADTANGDRWVVVKFPQPMVATDATHHSAFLREAWVSARIHSPWIGEVIEVPAERQTCLYSTMPFYEGETLEKRLGRKPRLNLRDGVEIAIKLCKAVAALHRAGIIHRDIKPDNVILEPRGGLRLIDLGVVRLPRIEDFPAADIPGTPSYMAPELLAGQAGDELSDVYALGITVYRAFSNHYPYGEVEPFSRPRFGKPAPLSRYRPDLPGWLDAVLDRAVAVDRRDRVADAIEFASELESGLARGSPVSLRKPPLYDRNPVRFWQTVSLVLALTLLFSAL
ncbi:bifunctional protein-serine/threonine kinase/phosphatase (plasmid) [Skermanella sp. TT6]|uniref:Bifunctional protein-serine/threonine kinase/phosphatase n=1 Tax=Skermanella cutis TaxID=2775420 RepID=A0ABX7BHT6_9PROT|nr:bifunctional protein-serine/threonine kinase/phosphatase [Skermanella sp. TT6]QQP93150.1 bifunctional protein-serine/threonine kinase/phosphatase [Skermanella sp. TT6]